LNTLRTLTTIATVVGLTLAVLGTPPAASGQESGTERSGFYYAYGQKVELTLITNQIGVLLREEMPTARAEEMLASPEMRSTAGNTTLRQLDGRFLVISLPSVVSTASLVKAADQLKSSFPELVARSGLLVRPAGSEMPMLLARDFIARFRSDVAPDAIETFNREHGVEVVTADPYAENQFLLQVASGSPLDTLATANLYQESSLVEFAHPNFTKVVVDRQTIPNDPFFPNQWHHDNAGASGGTVDADVDSPEAWDLELGDPGVVVAVVDSGFDANHPDLTANLWANPGETAGNGMDDDGNGRVDDVSGWDFTGCDAFPTPPAASCGDANVTGGNHGTAVAGLVAARGDNNTGVSGACPRCRIMLIRRASTDFGEGLMFGYLRQEGADISTNSWGFAIGTPCSTNLCTAINTAATAGVLTFFAMNNANVNDCSGSFPDISSLASVVAVSASSNQDRKVTESAFGNCMELLGPTHRGYGGGTPYTGTLNIATTDRVGTAGYNNTSLVGAACPSTEPANRDYTLCFGGTSAATPTTAGIAALALSADTTLTRQQLQRLLQDTADKTQDSAGAYATETGFSSPASGNATHGWGRVNSFEAVRVAASTGDGGRGGRDVFIRDNRLDWGNTEQPSNTLFEPTRGFIPHWRSVDIKVDAPPYQTAPTTSAAFDAFTDEDPRSLATNRVYVRVRNRGPRTVSSVTVKLHWAFAGAALPALPTDFWTTFPADSTDTSKWKPLGVRTVTSLAYSGASAAGCPGRTQPPCGSLTDDAQIVQFNFPAPAIDPTAAHPRHYCLLAMLDSSSDPISAASKSTLVVDTITPNDNNITHRNVVLQDPTRFGPTRFFVRNPTAVRQTAIVRIDAPEGWQVSLEGIRPGVPFTLDPGAEMLVTLHGNPPARARGTVEIVQELPDATPPIYGGLTVVVGPDLDGLSPPPTGWAVSLHLGLASPRGTLGHVYDDGPAVTFDLTRPLTDRLSWVLYLGGSRFDGEGDLDDYDAWNLSSNVKLRLFGTGTWYGFVNGGVGAYSLDGTGPEGGFNLGAGVGLHVAPPLALEATYNYHETVTASPDIKFDTAQLGFVWSF